MPKAGNPAKRNGTFWVMVPKESLKVPTWTQSAKSFRAAANWREARSWSGMRADIIKRG
jgi:hypothetical protein